MKFYCFKQNNSGGSFVVDVEKGINATTIIEANNATEANNIAERHGIYFSGVSAGFDCECCGDRWYRVDEYDGEDFPHKYGKPLEFFNKYYKPKDISIIYYNGRIINGEGEQQ